jgi:hypothetical protein
MVIKYLGNDPTPTRFIVAGRVIFASVAATLHDVGDANFDEIARLFPGLFEVWAGEPVIANPPTPSPEPEPAPEAAAVGANVGSKKRK